MKKAVDEQEGGNHYKSYAIQPIVFCHRNNIGCIESGVIKYVMRHKSKGGKLDLLKAKHLIDILLELEYANTD